MNTLRTLVEVKVNTKDITRNISGDPISFTYSDSATGEADSIDLSIQNRDGRWMGKWFPNEGDTIRAKIKQQNPKRSLDCGNTILDDISFSAWPMAVTIKGLALPMNTDFSDVKKNRTWSGARLSEIARSIADADGIGLDFYSSYDPVLPFTSQKEESDKSFLNSLAQKYGLSLKMYSNKAVLFDLADFEKKKSILTLTPKDLISFSCNSSITNTGYSSCVVKYTNADGRTLEYTYSVQGKTGKTYRHNTQLGSLAEAQRVAAAMLQEKNREQTTFSGSLPGDIRIVSCICLKLLGFGKFDGKYLADSATHTVSGGYTTSFEAHKVLLYG